jgi:hypothetical protein
MMNVTGELGLPDMHLSQESDNVDCWTCFCCSKNAKKVTVNKYEKQSSSSSCLGSLLTFIQRLCCCCFSRNKTTKEDNEHDHKEWTVHERLPEQSLITAEKTDSRIADKNQIKFLKEQLRIVKYYLELEKLGQQIGPPTPHSGARESTPITCKITKNGKSEDFKESKIRKDFALLGFDEISLNELIARIKDKIMHEEEISTKELREIILQELQQMGARLRKPSIATKLEAAQKGGLLHDLVEKRISNMPLEELGELAEFLQSKQDQTEIILI